MRETRVSLPELGLIAMTRAALGVGVGLLVAGALGTSARRTVGWALVVTGGLATIPLALEVLQRNRMSRGAHAVDGGPGSVDGGRGSHDRPRPGAPMTQS